MTRRRRECGRVELREGGMLVSSGGRGSRGMVV